MFLANILSVQREDYKKIHFLISLCHLVLVIGTVPLLNVKAIIPRRLERSRLPRQQYTSGAKNMLKRKKLDSHSIHFLVDL